MLSQRRPLSVPRIPIVPSAPSGSGGRHWWLDAVRGSLVLFMVVFHFLFDLAWLDIWGTLQGNNFWVYGGAAIAGSFLGVAGISMGLRGAQAPATLLRRKCLGRGFQLLSLGGGITILSLVVSPKFPIWFGILHCLGVSTLVAIPMLKKSPLQVLALGVLLLVLTYVTHNTISPSPLLKFLGLRSASPVAQGDYFPVLPWTGVFLLGMTIGVTLTRRTQIGPISSAPTQGPLRGLVFVGRHSLSIYLIHQPVLLGILHLMKNRGLL